MDDISATVPLARSGVFGPRASCHNFQSSSLCFPSTSLHLPSSSLQPLADGPLAMADGQSSMVNGPWLAAWFIFHGPSSILGTHTPISRTTCMTFWTLFVQPFFDTPFLEPKSPTCPTMIQKVTQK